METVLTFCSIDAKKTVTNIKPMLYEIRSRSKNIKESKAQNLQPNNK